MKNWFKKKGRFENCIYIVLSLFIIGIGLYFGISNNQINGISILHPSVFGWPMVVLGTLLLGFEIYYLISKNQNLLKVKKWLYLVIICISFIIIFDLLILGLVRAIIVVNGLSKKPTADYPLMIRLVYICKTKYKEILMGVGTTLWLSLAGTLIGLVLGLLFVSFRTLEVTPYDSEIVAFFKKIAIGFTKFYVTIFRGTPMLVQAIIIYYFLPGILSLVFKVEQDVFNKILTAGVAGLITVSLNTTAYLTEVLRGGIEALNKGQMEAARSLGMSRFQAMIHVILPQGIKNSLPSICNEFIINIKDTSVLSVISVMDLFFAIDSINGKAGNQDGIFIAAIIYLALTFGISKLLGLIEKKMSLDTKPLPSSN